jgi:hypothetical protein
MYFHEVPNLGGIAPVQSGAPVQPRPPLRVIRGGGRGGPGGRSPRDAILSALIQARGVAARALIDVVDDSRTSAQRREAALGSIRAAATRLLQIRPTVTGEVVQPLNLALQGFNLHALTVNPMTPPGLTRFREVVTHALSHLWRAALARRRQLVRT